MDLTFTLQQDDDWFAVGGDEQDYLDDLSPADDEADVAEDSR